MSAFARVLTDCHEPDSRHAPRIRLVVRGLGGVADHPDDRVPAQHRERVGGCIVVHQADQAAEFVVAGQVSGPGPDEPVTGVGAAVVSCVDAHVPRKSPAVATRQYR